VSDKHRCGPWVIGANTDPRATQRTARPSTCSMTRLDVYRRHQMKRRAGRKPPWSVRSLAVQLETGRSQHQPHATRCRHLNNLVHDSADPFGGFGLVVAEWAFHELAFHQAFRSEDRPACLTRMSDDDKDTSLSAIASANHVRIKKSIVRIVKEDMPVGTAAQTCGPGHGFRGLSKGRSLGVTWRQITVIPRLAR
jgi:hypothetical protein